MVNLQLTLLGGFEANGSSGSAVRFPTRKTKALLAYLTLNGDRTHSRGKLAGLLWGASDEQHARSSLRQALSRLKKSLPPPGPCWLIADGEPFDIVPLEKDDTTLDFSLDVSGRRYVRAELRGHRGRPERGEVVWAMTNPIWVREQ